MKYARSISALLALVMMCLPGSANGKDKNESRRPQKSGGSAEAAPNIELTPDSATIDSILNQAVKNIAARYNLNEAQTEKTNEIMRREVYKFLQTHEEKVWPIIRDLIQAQLGNKPPNDKDVMQRIGKAAGPMMQMVEEAILRGNEEWRMYLSPDQKRMHDYDLSEMERTFEQLEQNFQSWAEAKPNDGPLFPPPPPPQLSPQRPKKPSDGLPEPEIEFFRPTLFETFVEEFIEKYKLDKSQIETARSILVEFQGKANDFKNSKKSELKQIALAMRVAHEQADRKKLQAAEAERKALLEPVHRLFGEMNDRLMALLTTAQVERHAAASGTGRGDQHSEQPVDKKPGGTTQRESGDKTERGSAPPSASKEKG